MPRTRHPSLTFALAALFVLDVASDIACGVELILNDHYSYGLWVLGVAVVFPVTAAVVAEILRGCVYTGCCGEAGTDWIPLIFYHPYTLIVLIGSHCQPRWLQEAHYLRAVEGFLQAGPQIIIQLVTISQGVLIHSLRDLLKNILDEGFSWQFFQDKPLRWYWGLIQVWSLLLSLASFLQTCVHFNEWPKRRHTIHRMLVVIPFFAFTLLYRALSASTLIVFCGQVALFPIAILVLAQIVTLCSLGLDLPRGVVYGLCSLLCPVGYGRCRDPDGQPLGISLLPGYSERYSGSSNCSGSGSGSGSGSPGEGDRSPEQVDMLRERSRHFLAMHLILGGGILGIAVAILGLLLNFTDVFQPLADWVIFNQQQLNDLVFPALAGSYLCSALFTAVFTCCIGRCFEEEYIYPV